MGLLMSGGTPARTVVAIASRKEIISYCVWFYFRFCPGAPILRTHRLGRLLRYYLSGV